MTSRRYTRHEIGGAVVGGGVSVLVLFVIIIGIGRVGSFEALRLIEAAKPTALFMAAAVLGGAITVLALLLTLLGLSLASEFSFSVALYHQTAFLTRLSVAAIGLATLVLLAVAVPIEEVEEVARYYAFFYYALAAALALLGGLAITIGIIIGFILRSLIAVGHPEEESELIEDGGDDGGEQDPRSTTSKRI